MFATLLLILAGVAAGVVICVCFAEPIHTGLCQFLDWLDRVAPKAKAFWAWLRSKIRM